MEFFPKEHPEGLGYQGGSEKNLQDIEKHVKPVLNSLGYDCRKVDPESITSNKQILFPYGHPETCIRVKIIVIEDLHRVNTRINSNIPEEIVNATTEDKRIQTHWNILGLAEEFLFVYIVRGGWIFLAPFTSIPVSKWVLTYRDTETKRLNRMWTPSSSLTFRSNRYILSELQKALKQ